METQKAAKPKPKIRPLRLILLIIIVVLLTLGVPFFIKDAEAWNRYNTLKTEVNTIEEQSLKPLGAIPSTNIDASYLPYETGKGLLGNIGCIDVECPAIGVVWFTLVDPNQEESILKDVLRNHKYDFKDDIFCQGSICSVYADNLQKNMDINLSFSPIEKYREVLKDKDGKKWRILSLNISYK